MLPCATRPWVQAVQPTATVLVQESKTQSLPVYETITPSAYDHNPHRRFVSTMPGLLAHMEFYATRTLMRYFILKEALGHSSSVSASSCM